MEGFHDNSWLSVMSWSLATEVQVTFSGTWYVLQVRWIQAWVKLPGQFAQLPSNPLTMSICDVATELSLANSSHVAPVGMVT